MADFEAWFRHLTAGSIKPHAWQRALSTASEPTNRTIRIPTGMGKTLGVFATWSWNRLHLENDAWPRRLIWCLPMRVLVEQTEEVIRKGLAHLELLWKPGTPRSGKVGVHQLMGGADPGGDWNLYPEECAVLIGTQDMLLSRALNRGYGSGRAAWPLEFGLLSHDSLWIMDEVQLMDVGLATSAQLQAFHDDDRSKGFRPRLTWWMSATLQPEWLESVDTVSHCADWTRGSVAIPIENLSEGLGAIRKSLDKTSVAAADAKSLAQRAIEEHGKLVDSEFGLITLVICNTVDRACATFEALRSRSPTKDVQLVHGRFRPYERASWRERFLNRSSCARGVDRLIVSTQVVEAGVDVSAGCVITELAPWPSLVQRFGRCARYGGSGHVLVVDRGRDDRTAPPYQADELKSAWSALESIDEVGIVSLERFEQSLEDDQLKTLFPYQPKHLLVRRELDELFDTTADLTGADLDVSRFIRSGDNRDLQVFWIDVGKPVKGKRPPDPPRSRLPRREELCSVGFLSARDWLCGAETREKRRSRLKTGFSAWVWDFVEGNWVSVDRSLLTPGRIVCVAAHCGGYRIDRGFDPAWTEAVPEVPPLARLPRAVEDEQQADNSQDGEDLSAADWKTILCHTAEAVDCARGIAGSTRLPDSAAKVLDLACRWHDIGKSHPAFQGAIRGQGRPARNDLAKAPSSAWVKPPGTYRTENPLDKRPGLRHELASALALFAVLERHRPRHPALLGPWVEVLSALGHSVPENPAGTSPTVHESAVLDCTADEFDLLMYLVACHHGKVRVALHAAPKDQEYVRVDADDRGLPIRGVRNGDALYPVAIGASSEEVSALVLSLEPAMLGLSARTGRSWRERTLGLLDRFGPGALAWLEALMIAADRRASQLRTHDALIVLPPVEGR